MIILGQEFLGPQPKSPKAVSTATTSTAMAFHMANIFGYWINLKLDCFYFFVWFDLGSSITVVDYAVIEQGSYKAYAPIRYPEQIHI